MAMTTNSTKSILCVKDNLTIATVLITSTSFNDLRDKEHDNFLRWSEYCLLCSLNYPNEIKGYANRTLSYLPLLSYWPIMSQYNGIKTIW